MIDSSIDEKDLTMLEASVPRCGRRSAGDEILGRYVVQTELGEGGMGVVYKCFDKVGGVEVAIKGLPPEVVHNRDELEAVKDNFQLVRGLRHPNIAAALTLERDERTQEYYLVMDYAPGESLNRWMAKHRGEADRTQQLSILRQIAEALDYAHQAHPVNIIHRDIKPENILVDAAGRVKILDFGLAAQVRTSLSHVSMQVRSKSGTPAYKSPEQWRGQPQRAPADQYALAVIAYKMFSGEVPFDGDDMEILGRAVLNEPVPPVKGASPVVNAALAKGLAKQGEDRFETCADFVAALEGKKIAAKGARRLGKWIAAILCVALAAAAGVWGWNVSQQRQREERARIAAQGESERVDAEMAAREQQAMAEYAALDLSSRAESAHSLIAQEPEEVRKVFDAEIRNFENSRRAGDDAKRMSKNVMATNFLTQALAKATDLKRLVDQRSNSLEAISTAAKAKAAADAVEAEKALGLRYKTALKAFKEAESAASERRFAEAAEKARDAAGQFTSIRADVIRAALEVAKRHRDEKRWELCLAEAEKVLAWEPSNTEAKSIREEAQQQLRPSVRVSARIGEREVSAVAIIQGENLALPHEIRDLAKGETWPKVDALVTFREGGKRYKGMLAGRKVDWQGRKEIAVALKEVKVDGLYKVIDLTDGSVEDLDAVPTGGWREEHKTCKLVLRRIEPGKFLMGSSLDELGRHSEEEQQKLGLFEDLHSVTLTKPYYIGVFEMTWGQWQCVMRSPNQKNTPEEERCPVEGISYDDVRGDFLQKLRTQTGCNGFDLPTEAQWEYACRAGSTTAYFWGNALNGDHANCNGNNPCGTEKSGTNKGRSCDVGSYEPNGWGLYDMHGNAWEWCLDSVEAHLRDATDPLCLASDEWRIARGGSWRNPARCCRSAHRIRVFHGFRNEYYGSGFRLCCAAEGVQQQKEVVPITRGKIEKGQRHATKESAQGADSKEKVTSGGLYKVVDLRDWTISDLDTAPVSGWTEEYKTAKIVLRRIEPGSFIMGSPKKENYRDTDEARHGVKLTNPYYIGVFEVTEMQWALVNGLDLADVEQPTHPQCASYKDIRGGENGVKWPQSACVDVQSFMGKLRTKTSLNGFDLPTEAQWEYACRAGDATAIFACDENLIGDIAWYGNVWESKNEWKYEFERDRSLACALWTGKQKGHLKRHIVGLKKPNNWGLYDMLGNMWEWCLDWYGAYEGDHGTVSLDPVGPKKSSVENFGSGYRILRGGGWFSAIGECRPASRLDAHPNSFGHNHGLRLVYNPFSTEKDKAVAKLGSVPSPSVAGDGTPTLNQCVATGVDVSHSVSATNGEGVQLWENGPYWAECNVGATKPEESGYYFWWGDTVGYRCVDDQWQAVDGSRRNFQFREENCPTYDKNESQLQAEGYIDTKRNLLPAHDAATAHLGSPWRMPTEKEIEALEWKCTSEWTLRNGVVGRLVTGKGAYSSKSIFLPVVGYVNGSFVVGAGSDGDYWSSTPYPVGSDDACDLHFDSRYFMSSHSQRFLGQSVRPLRGFAK